MKSILSGVRTKIVLYYRINGRSCMQKIYFDGYDGQNIWIDFRDLNKAGDVFPATISTAGDRRIQSGEHYQLNQNNLHQLSDGTFHILQYTQRGMGRIRYREENGRVKEYDLGPEQCFFISHDQQFEFFNPENCFYSYIYISFRGALADHVFARLLEQQPVLRLPRDSETVGLFHQLFNSVLHGRIDRCALRRIATDILLDLETELCDCPSRVDNDFLRQAADWAHENMACASVSSLAAHFHVSEKYFQAVFKKKCGMTPGKFLANLRMNFVKRLLECTEMKLSGIAEVAGFADASHLCRVFRQTAGVTPDTFRHCCFADGHGIAPESSPSDPETGGKTVSDPENRTDG